jgi:cytochrome c553
VAQLHAFRGGTRKPEVVSMIAKHLSYDDIAALAAWYSAVKVEARLP